MLQQPCLLLLPWLLVTQHAALPQPGSLFVRNLHPGMCKRGGRSRLPWEQWALHLVWAAEGVCRWSHCCGVFSYTSALPFGWHKNLCSHVVVWMAWKVTNFSSLFLSQFSARPVASPVYSAAAQWRVLAMLFGQCGHGTVFSGATPTSTSLKFVTQQSHLAIPLISHVVLLLKR